MSNQQAITEMFDSISMHYDFLNHLLSLNIDKLWRRRIAKTVAGFHPARILDVATGTADLAIRLAKGNPEAHITGIDLSEQMLRIGQEKVKKAGLNVIDLESDQKLQDLVLSLHHSYIITLEHSLITKMVENQIGSTYIRALPVPQEVQQKFAEKQ